MSVTQVYTKVRY